VCLGREAGDIENEMVDAGSVRLNPLDVLYCDLGSLGKRTKGLGQ